nr:acyltransferase family protein [Ornithinimicrobium sp. F0845]
MHGLRGLAILLVVLFHVFGAGRVSGGIDVFLAISGFLFTASLFRRAVVGRPAGSGRLDLRGYFAQLARRLLPPAVLTLAAVAVVGHWVLPRSDHPQLARELRATLFYRENWELIDSQLVYGAAGPDASPLQHFWSLSVQGQFYLVWLGVIVGAVWLARRLNRSPLAVTGVVVAVLTAASFAFAVHEHERNQAVAYLHTGTRLWELGLAGLFALLIGFAAGGHLAPRPVRIILGWVGVAMLVSCGFLFDGAQLFPGPWALWPVASLLLVLLAGRTDSRFGADRALTTRPLTWLGTVAYPLYLWHWPLLVFTLHRQGAERADLPTAVMVVLASLVLASMTNRLVERPITGHQLRGARERMLVLVVSGVVVASGAVALTFWQERLEDDQRAELAAAAVRSPEHPGAAVMAPGAAQVDPTDPVPSPAVAREDKPSTYDQDCVQSHEDTPETAEVLLCTDDVADPTRTLLITGGSHAHMWQPAFEVLAEQYGWSVLVMDKSACQLTSNSGQFSEETDQPTSASCQAWNVSALADIVDLAPDGVVTIGTTTTGDRERYSLGFQEVWAQLAGHDIPVIAIRDTARMAGNVPRCLEDGGDATSCGQARDAVLGPRYPVAEDPARPENVVPVDLTDYLCTEQWCPAVIGNVLVYRDHSHLTATFARSLAPFLDEQLRVGAPWLYDVGRGVS